MSESGKQIDQNPAMFDQNKINFLWPFPSIQVKLPSVGQTNFNNFFNIYLDI